MLYFQIIKIVFFQHNVCCFPFSLNNEAEEIDYFFTDTVLTKFYGAASTVSRKYQETLNDYDILLPLFLYNTKMLNEVWIPNTELWDHILPERRYDPSLASTDEHVDLLLILRLFGFMNLSEGRFSINLLEKLLYILSLL